MKSLNRDIAAELHPVYGAASTAVTAGAGSDGTAVNGASLALADLPTRFESVAFALAAAATLAEDKTLTVAAKIQTSADGGSTWDDIRDSETVITLTGGTGGTSETGAAIIGVSLEYAAALVRVVFTPTMSATATDTAVIQTTALFGGAARNPA